MINAEDADALALHYALTSGYSEISSSAKGSEFDYSTTDSIEDWYHSIRLCFLPSYTGAQSCSEAILPIARALAECWHALVFRRSSWL